MYQSPFSALNSKGLSNFYATDLEVGTSPSPLGIPKHPFLRCVRLCRWPTWLSPSFYCLNSLSQKRAFPVGMWELRGTQWNVGFFPPANFISSSFWGSLFIQDLWISLSFRRRGSRQAIPPSLELILRKERWLFLPRPRPPNRRPISFFLQFEVGLPA